MTLKSFGDDSISTPIDPMRTRQILTVGGVVVGSAVLLSFLRGKQEPVIPDKAPPDETVTITTYQLSMVTTTPSPRAGSEVAVAYEVQQPAEGPPSTLRLEIGGTNIVQTITIPQVQKHSDTVKLILPADLRDGIYQVIGRLLTGGATKVTRQFNIAVQPTIIPPVTTPVPSVPSQLPAPTGLTQFVEMTTWPDNITLRWQNPVGTRWIKFELEPVIRSTSEIVKPGIPQIVLKDVQEFKLPTPRIGRGEYILLPDSEYTWRVFASGAQSQPEASNLSQWGPPGQSSFRTPVASPESLQLTAPRDNETNVSVTPLLQWTDNVPYVFMYEVQISAAADFSGETRHLVIHGGQTTPLLSLPVGSKAITPTNTALEPGLQYWWRVRPHTDRGTGWSRARTFKTVPARRTQEPAPIGGGSPSLPADTTPRIEWNHSETTRNVEVRIARMDHVDSIAIYAASIKRGNQPDPGTWTRYGTIRAPEVIVVDKEPHSPYPIYIALVAYKTGQEILTGNPAQPGYLNTLAARVDAYKPPTSSVPPAPAPSAPPPSVESKFTKLQFKSNWIVDVTRAERVYRAGGTGTIGVEIRNPLPELTNVSVKGQMINTALRDGSDLPHATGFVSAGKQAMFSLWFTLPGQPGVYQINIEIATETGGIWTIQETWGVATIEVHNI